MRGATTVRVVCSLGLALGIFGTSLQLTAAQSPSAGASSPPGSPGASSSAGVESPGASASAGVSPSESPLPAATPGGPIAWKIDRKSRDLSKAWFITDVAQSADATSVLVGLVRAKTGHPLAAAWRSTVPGQWSRINWGAQDPSAASAIVATATGFVAVGLGGDVWTSPDGTTWAHQIVPESAFHDVAQTETGLVAVGQPVTGAHTAAALWTSSDAVTWQPMTLAADGEPLQVAVAPDGTIVAAGLLYDATGSTPMPQMWRIVDGTVTQSALDGLEVAPSSVTGLEWTPFGFVVAVIQNVGAGQVSSLWTSADGQAWQDVLDVPDGLIRTLGIRGSDAIALAVDRMWQSSDGATWDVTPEPGFKGYTLSALTQLIDGHLLAAGTLVTGPSSNLAASFTGVSAPAPVLSPAPSVPTEERSPAASAP